jgi:hypothetical protein
VTSQAKKSDMAKPRKMSRSELAKLGGGELAYIRHMNVREAKRLFPAIKGLPADAIIFSLHGADGTPLCLADSEEAAVAHAQEVELAVARLH